ncbi:MAG TPA: hypothetical protein PLT93_18775, partial [Phycisphaerae bacterium]|nr:hypothetical protein [Phycisphaerae bacterium]
RWARLTKQAGLAILGGLWLLSTGACFAPPGDTVYSTVTGEVITLEEINPILNDPELTEAEKREQLQELGVPDDLVETLLRA